ncbi:MAG: hypothetical protein O7D32_08130 [bacterium]|nr:hypothetical protein [bacterium]
MRLKIFVTILLIVLIPTFIYGEILHLKDGSMIKGKVISFEGDTLHFMTSFGSELRIHKDNVLRIEFTDEPMAPPPVLGGPTSTEPGSLIVRFSKMKLTSKISVHRNQDREGHELENAIEQSLTISGKKVFSRVDTTTDKIIYKGPETVLKNEFKPVEMRVGMPAGIYQVKIAIVNPYVEKYVKSFPDEPLYKDVFVDAVVINAGGFTVVQVGKRRKRLGLAGYELYAVTSN